jgi:hypothetical protein
MEYGVGWVFYNIEDMGTYKYGVRGIILPINFEHSDTSIS